MVRNGQVVAERYANGYGVETPILGFSATKSVMSALTGILVRKGKLTLDRPAPVVAWQGPGDPGKRSRSIISCGIPRAWRSAVRCRLRSHRCWSRSIE